MLLLFGVVLAFIGAALVGGSAGKTVDAFALVSLTALLGMYALRGAWKRAVAVAVCASGICIFGFGVSADQAIANGLLAPAAIAVLWAGVLMLRRAARWPSMSTRYEREVRAAGKPLTAWDAIDRGEDPTA